MSGMALFLAFVPFVAAAVFVALFMKDVHDFNDESDESGHDEASRRAHGRS
jgi:hypothetical protein